MQFNYTFGRLSSCFLLFIAWIIIFLIPTFSKAEIETPNEFVMMSTKNSCAVYRSSNVNTAVFARISRGATVKVKLKKKMSDCQAGWYEREEGGYICGKNLVPTNANLETPGEGDEPTIRDGYTTVKVTAKKTSAFTKQKYLTRGYSDAVLLRGSVLTIKGKTESRGKIYYETRQGWFVLSSDCEMLPEDPGSLAVDIPENNDIPAYIVYGKNSRKALVRQAPMPKNLEEKEKWIGVDLEQQLLTAYEGHRPVRLMPCSTGIRGNTDKGQFTITRKLKQQTLRLKMCRIRVEDVQWVMYYDEPNAIAIHSAYWHHEFGTPVSQGCVNLPPDDAKWLFNWASPKSATTDSITLPLPRGTGTKVIVF